MLLGRDRSVGRIFFGALLFGMAYYTVFMVITLEHSTVIPRDFGVFKLGYQPAARAHEFERLSKRALFVFLLAVSVVSGGNIWRQVPFMKESKTDCFSNTTTGFRCGLMDTFLLCTGGNRVNPATLFSNLDWWAGCMPPSIRAVGHSMFLHRGNLFVMNGANARGLPFHSAYSFASDHPTLTNVTDVQYTITKLMPSDNSGTFPYVETGQVIPLGNSFLIMSFEAGLAWEFFLDNDEYELAYRQVLDAGTDLMLDVLRTQVLAVDGFPDYQQSLDNPARDTLVFVMIEVANPASSASWSRYGTVFLGISPNGGPDGAPIIYVHSATKLMRELYFDDVVHFQYFRLVQSERHSVLLFGSRCDGGPCRIEVWELRENATYRFVETILRVPAALGPPVIPGESFDVVKVGGTYFVMTAGPQGSLLWWYMEVDYDNATDLATSPCPAGRFLYRRPASHLCMACPPNSFTDGPNADQCTPCPPDSVAAGRGNTQCVRCPPGTFALASHQTCIPCPEGSYNPTANATCLPCPPDAACPPGSAHPLPASAARASFFSHDPYAQQQNMHGAEVTFYGTLAGVALSLVLAAVALCFCRRGLARMDLFFSAKHPQEALPARLYLRRTQLGGAVSLVLLVLLSALCAIHVYAFFTAAPQLAEVPVRLLQCPAPPNDHVPLLGVLTITLTYAGLPAALCTADPNAVDPPGACAAGWRLPDAPMHNQSEAMIMTRRSCEAVGEDEACRVTISYQLRNMTGTPSFARFVELADPLAVGLRVDASTPPVASVVAQADLQWRVGKMPGVLISESSVVHEFRSADEGLLLDGEDEPALGLGLAASWLCMRDQATAAFDGTRFVELAPGVHHTNLQSADAPSFYLRPHEPAIGPPDPASANLTLVITFTNASLSEIHVTKETSWIRLLGELGGLVSALLGVASFGLLMIENCLHAVLTRASRNAPLVEATALLNPREEAETLETGGHIRKRPAWVRMVEQLYELPTERPS
ncbi:hypothetical protein PAPYR_2547 [Paratrimastix pyriformis]|uniref:Tyrosine-protein kinase ephrin type A/B receptor-like domain-containing protein n=1 Tax=Paratrimastix pyriformis TaxID=342808 RepID=A0ABQ8UWG1_9EUKA|nr:hypothetical protein PAPYR_2547 [Paratrimastix pyriformis]